MQTVHRYDRAADNADDHGHNLSRWDQVYAQFSPGRFIGHITEFWFTDGIQLFHESANQALRQSCSAWPDALWIGIPEHALAGARIDGSGIPKHVALLRSGGTQFDLYTPKNYGLYGFVINRNLLEYHQILADNVSRLLGHGGVLHVSAPTHKLIVNMLHQLLLNSKESDCAVAEKMFEVEEVLFDRLDSMLERQMTSNYSTDTRFSKSTSRRRRLVFDAVELVLTEPSRRVSVATLCQQLRVSRRTLQYCFQSVTGFAPLAYLRMIKLNCVQRELGRAAGLRVTDAAMKWGFDHLGQFAKDYSSLFGELPSTTLQKRRIVNYVKFSSTHR